MGLKISCTVIRACLFRVLIKALFLTAFLQKRSDQVMTHRDAVLAMLGEYLKGNLLTSKMNRNLKNEQYLSIPQLILFITCCLCFGQFEVEQGTGLSCKFSLIIDKNTALQMKGNIKFSRFAIIPSLSVILS